MSPIFRDKIGSLLGAIVNTNDAITNTNELAETPRKWYLKYYMIKIKVLRKKKIREIKIITCP